MRRRHFLYAASAAVAFSAPRAALGQEYGAFRGEFVGRYLGPQRFELLEALTYIDPSGLEWTAKAGAIVNGASIPHYLWSFIGGPFTDNYVKASVVHDYFCVTRERDWRATHRSFYWACRAEGLGATKAKLAYAGVFGFGPRWVPVSRSGLAPEPLPQPEFDEAKFEEIRRLIEANDPSIDEINRLLL